MSLGCQHFIALRGEGIGSRAIDLSEELLHDAAFEESDASSWGDAVFGRHAVWQSATFRTRRHLGRRCLHRTQTFGEQAIQSEAAQERRRTPVAVDPCHRCDGAQPETRGHDATEKDALEESPRTPTWALS